MTAPGGENQDAHRDPIRDGMVSKPASQALTSALFEMAPWAHSQSVVLRAWIELLIGAKTPERASSDEMATKRCRAISGIEARSGTHTSIRATSARATLGSRVALGKRTSWPQCRDVSRSWLPNARAKPDSYPRSRWTVRSAPPRPALLSKPGELQPALGPANCRAPARFNACQDRYTTCSHWSKTISKATACCGIG